jgi:hypothetical protein
VSGALHHFVHHPLPAACVRYLCPALPPLHDGCVRRKGRARADVGHLRRRRPILRRPQSRKKKKVNNVQRNAWRADYKAKYGLMPSFDTSSRVLVSAKCRFCISFGREVEDNGAPAPPNLSSSGGAPSATAAIAASAAASSSVSKKWGPNTVRAFSTYITDQFLSHLRAAHRVKWDAYQKRTVGVEDFFRQSGDNRQLTIPKVLGKRGRDHCVVIPRKVVTDILVPIAMYDIQRRKMRKSRNHSESESDGEDWEELGEASCLPHAMKRLFVEIPRVNGSADAEDDADEARVAVDDSSRRGDPGTGRRQVVDVASLGQPGDFIVTVSHPRRFQFVTGMLAGPRSFRSIAETTRLIKVSEGMALGFPVATPTDVSDIARQVGGIYLASLSALLRSSNGYALACDGGEDNTSIKYFDIRVRLFVKGKSVNLHVCVLPESESATGLFMYKTLDTVMTAMDVLWKSKVIGINTDGASAMTGWSAGLASRVVEAASSECYRV